MGRLERRPIGGFGVGGYKFRQWPYCIDEFILIGACSRCSSFPEDQVGPAGSSGKLMYLSAPKRSFCRKKD